MNPQAGYIENLSSDLTPVKTIAKPLSVSIGLTLSAVGLVAIVLLMLFGHRESMPVGNALEITLINELGSLIAIFACAYSIGLLRVPGLDSARANLTATAILILTPALLLIVDASLHAHSLVSSVELNCTWRLLLLTIPSGILAIVVAKRGAPASPYKVSIICAIFAVSVGALTLPLVCDNSSAVHIVVFHFFVPIFLSIAAFSALTRKLIRW
jgi:hypothetical protein